MDPFALPCHPDLAVSPQDRDWRSIGVRSQDDVTRKQTRCPQCKTPWTAFLRTFPAADTATGDTEPSCTVEWVRATPFRVCAAPLPLSLPSAPVWQDATTSEGAQPAPDVDRGRALRELQEQTSGLGRAWERSVQLVAPVHPLAAGGEVFAEPGELLLERREKWNAQDRRLALVWSPRRRRPVVAWHGFARLLQLDGQGEAD